MTIKLGYNPNDSIDDSLCALYSHSVSCTGPERDVIFSFFGSRPVAAGSQPEAGGLEFRMENDRKEWMHINGNFDSAAITIIYTDSRENSFTATLDRTGVVADN
jgi:hypothetical protein